MSGLLSTVIGLAMKLRLNGGVVGQAEDMIADVEEAMEDAIVVCSPDNEAAT